MKTRKIITVFLALVLAMSMGITPVFADDSEPASVQDTYEYDGVTYVNVGDKVITSKYSGTDVKLDGEEYTIVRQSDILAVVE